MLGILVGKVEFGVRRSIFSESRQTGRFEWERDLVRASGGG